jgi:cell division GTPase FtsZ
LKAKPQSIYKIGEGGEPLRVAVVGCGGAGCNSLKYAPGNLGIETFALNDDPRKGFGKLARRSMVVPAHELAAASDTDPRISIAPLVRSAGTLAESFSGQDAVFAVCGLGGDSGWRCAALAVRSAREAGALAVCVVVLPFSAEAPTRREAALFQADRLRRLCDGLVVLRNDRILAMAPRLPFARAMEVVSELAMLVPRELAAAANVPDAASLREIFSKSDYLAADVASAPHGDEPADLAGAIIGSEWMSVEPADVKTALVLVGGPSGDAVDEVAREVRASLPNLGAMAYGASGQTRGGGKSLRAFAVLGLSGELR